MPYISHTSTVRKNILAVVTAVVLIAVFLTGSMPPAHAQGAPALFADAGAADLAATSTEVARARYLNVNLGLLVDGSGKARDVSTLPEITLNLFPDVNYTGLIDQVETTEGDSTSWIGRLAGVDGGYFYLVESSDGGFIAHVASSQGVYEVSSAGDNLYRVIQIDQSKLMDEPNGGSDIPANDAPPSADLSSTATAASQIDVLVVYTAAALAGEGSLPALKARIALAITQTNQSYANSGIKPRLRLVHIQQLTYTESGNIKTDVARLAGTTDAFMNDVHGLRNAYGADVVSLIVQNGGGICGTADAIRATAATAFDVVTRSCLTSNYSFAHELGHLQGARADVAADPRNTPYAYGHGYVNTAARWRTVMAENKQCAALGFNCVRLQYWSNPSKTYGGAPMGNTTSRNYLVLNNTAATVANFRAKVISVNFNSNFNGSAAGWVPVSGGWGLASSAYYVTSGVPDTLSSIKHTGRYGDLTFTVRMKSSGPCTGCANIVIIRGNPANLNPDKVWRTSYSFDYSNEGRFSVFRENSNGTETIIKTWTPSSAIVKGGWNNVKVIAVGTLMRFFINGKQVWASNNMTLTTGQVGIGMYRSSGTASEKLYVDSASLTTTPTTADIGPFAEIAFSLTIPVGNVTYLP